MPTGYTQPIYDGKPVTFAEFALECARGIGYLAVLRDDPDAPIPSTFQPSSMYTGMLKNARREFEEISAWTDEVAERHAQEIYESALTERQERLDAKAALRGRLEAMLAEVHAWTPPTADHQGLKDLMIQQLEDAITHDCDTSYYLTPPKKMSGAEHKARRLVSLQDNIQYYTEQEEADRRRAEKRTQWVRDLRNSLDRAD